MDAHVCQIEIEKSRPIVPVVEQTATEETQDTVDADNEEAGGRREDKKRAAPRTPSKRSRSAR